MGFRVWVCFGVKGGQISLRPSRSRPLRNAERNVMGWFRVYGLKRVEGLGFRVIFRLFAWLFAPVLGTGFMVSGLGFRV